MPRPRSRSSYLEKASSRLALEPRGKSYRYKIDKALWLLYRRLKSSAGVWSAEATDGHGKPWVRKFATADDYEPSDGRTILGKWEAVEEAKKLARGDAGQPLTIRVAIERDYAGHIKTNGSSPGNVTRLLHHLPDDLANKPIGLATERDYARWVHSLLASGLARGTVRRTKVNLQAALELAVRLNPALAVYRNTWKTGLSGVSDVHNPRDVFLTVKEVGRLETAAHEVGGERFRNYVCAHYETAARSSQLARVQCGDLQADHPDGPRLLVPRSKKGRNGTRKTGEKIAVPITRGLAERLRVANAGRGATEPLFLRSDNRPWNPARGDHSRPFRQAAERAGLAGHTIYSLRHSAIGRMLMANLPMRLVASLVDSSTNQLESTYSRFIADYSGEVSRRGLAGLAEALS